MGVRVLCARACVHVRVRVGCSCACVSVQPGTRLVQAVVLSPSPHPFVEFVFVVIPIRPQGSDDVLLIVSHSTTRMSGPVAVHTSKI